MHSHTWRVPPPQVSEALVEKFVASEFDKADSDGSGSISLSEFTAYVTDMTRWMRSELLAQTHHKNVFSALATRAIEMQMEPMKPIVRGPEHPHNSPNPNPSPGPPRPSGCRRWHTS